MSPLSPIGRVISEWVLKPQFNCSYYLFQHNDTTFEFLVVCLSTHEVTLITTGLELLQSYIAFLHDVVKPAHFELWWRVTYSKDHVC